MMKKINLMVLCVMVTLFGCVHSSMPQKELTRVIVPRKTVQTKDTIMSRLGLELERVDSIVAAAPKEKIEILDLTGEDSIKPVPVKHVETVVTQPNEKPKAQTKVQSNVNPEAKPQIQPKKQPIVEESGNYHVIVASFPNESLAEAEKYVERLKKESPNAKLIITESRVRVAYSSHSTMAIATEARDSLAQNNTKYKDSWVLKRVLK